MTGIGGTRDWGLGIGDWRLEIGDYSSLASPTPFRLSLSFFPSPQSPAPSPQYSLLQKPNHVQEAVTGNQFYD